MLFPFSYVLIFLSICQGFFVEIGLLGRNESRNARNVKLMCGSLESNIYLKKNQKLLWKGSKFGYEEQQKLREIVDSETFLPAIAINSSERQRCYLITTKNNYKRWIKNRVLRNDTSASVPMERGACPPGYRIDLDRCFPCLPGSYTSGQSTKCFPCPKNYFMARKASDSCRPCPDGKKTVDQGADSVTSCIDFDEKGYPITKENPPWILIFSLIGASIACSWILLAYLLFRYCKDKGEDEPQRSSEKRNDDPLLSVNPGKGSFSDYSSSNSDEHLYAEIGDLDLYEEPIKPVYGQITATSGKLDATEKTRKRSLPSLPRGKASLRDVLRRISSRSHLYEIPRRKSSSDYYEVPRKKGDVVEDDIYENETPLPKSVSTGFEQVDSSTDIQSKPSESQLIASALLSETGIMNKSLSKNSPRGSPRPASSEQLRESGRFSSKMKFMKTMSDETMGLIPEENTDEDSMT